jgi:hypothetical protein
MTSLEARTKGNWMRNQLAKGALKASKRKGSWQQIKWTPLDWYFRKTNPSIHGKISSIASFKNMQKLLSTKKISINTQTHLTCPKSLKQLQNFREKFLSFPYGPGSPSP